MTPAVRSSLLTTIGRRLTPQPIKLRADIELTCYKPAGIDAIKAALKAGESVSSETVPIKAKLVAPPFYVLGTNATDRVCSDVLGVHGLFLKDLQVAGVEKLEEAIKIIQETIEGLGGQLNVKMRVSYVNNHTSSALTTFVGL